MYSSTGANLEFHQRLLDKTEKMLKGSYQHPFMLKRTGSSSSATRAGRLPKQAGAGGGPALQRTNTLGSNRSTPHDE